MAAKGKRRRLYSGAAAFQSFEVGKGLEQKAQTGMCRRGGIQAEEKAKNTGINGRYGNRRGNSGFYHPLMIGVAGSSPGVGTTHFSIMTDSYLSGVLGRRTALLEENKSGDFSRLFDVLSERSVLKQENGSCSVLEISFMKEASPETFSDLANSEFDTVVIDFGHDFEAVRTKFQLCQRKFLVGSLAEWKIHAFLKLAEEKKRSDGKWEYFISSGSGEFMKELARHPGIEVRRIPRTEDAFAVSGEVIAFFGGFL